MRPKLLSSYFFLPLSLFTLYSLLFTSYRLYAAEAEFSIRDRIAIETNLENRLRAVLTDLLGTDKITVSVSAELYEEKEKPPETKKAEEEEGFSLPGVPIQERIGEKVVTTQLPLAPLSLGGTRLTVKRIRATLALESTLSAEQVKNAEQVALRLLGINKTRGDSLEILQRAFPKQEAANLPGGPMENKKDWMSLLQPPSILFTAALFLGSLFIILTGAFLFGPANSLFKNVVSVMNAKTQTQAGPKGESQVETDAALPAGFLSQMESAQAGEGGLPMIDGHRPFNFLKPDHIKNLIFLIQHESPGRIAIVASYLPSEMAGQLISALNPQKQAQVASTLSKMAPLEPEEVKALESVIKGRIVYLMGGEEKLQAVLDYVEPDSQREILEALELSRPELAEKLKRVLFTFEDLPRLDGAALSAVLRRVTLPVFAQIMKVQPEEFQQALFSKLATGLVERLRQEMDFGKPMPQKRTELGKRRVLETVRFLEKQGLVDLSPTTALASAEEPAQAEIVQQENQTSQT